MQKSQKYLYDQRVLLGAMILVAFIGFALVAAAYKDDHKIESNLGITNAEVISAGSTRSAVSFYTEDGVNQNPETGIFYPSRLVPGDRIRVEYSKADPTLVRVAGRNARLALEPVLFWTIIVEIFLILVWIFLGRIKGWMYSLFQLVTRFTVSMRSN